MPILNKLYLYKKSKILVILLIIFIAINAYLFYEHDTLKNQTKNAIEKCITLKYQIYLKMLQNNTKDNSFSIENSNFIDNEELIEEYKKSSPFYVPNEDKLVSKYEINFKFFKHDEKTILNFINKLQNNSNDYIIEHFGNNQIQLFGKVFNKGYVLIRQNTLIHTESSKKTTSIFILFSIFSFIMIIYFLYLQHLNSSLESMSNNLKDTYEKLSIETRKMAFEDTLTKAATRLKFDETLSDLIRVSSRFEGQTFSLIILDIDNFKSINDTYGHDYGDIVLKNIANTVKCNIRTSDTFARWGGEEFVILSPLLDLQNAVELAEKIRVLITKINLEKIDSLSCSFGVVTYNENDDEDSIVKRADDLLYIAKKNGKNRVEF